MSKIINIEGKIISCGIRLSYQRKNYDILYPKTIWHLTPPTVKRALLDNLGFGSTHFLALLANADKIKYNTSFPLLESFLFKNQLYDLLSCENSDGAKHLSYLRRFYNLQFDFLRQVSEKIINNDYQTTETAIIPFTFGKESLTTFALCREIGLKPILVYCQEPCHPYEEKYKIKQLTYLSKKYNVQTHFIKNGPGLFRNSKLLNNKTTSEIGWGTQTTLLCLQMIP